MPEPAAAPGRITRERTLSVNIPAGVEDGTRIRLAGEGEAGLRGGPAGDLYIFLSIKPHAFFQRDGADLFCRVPISMITAALGGEVTCRPSTAADAKVKVPEGTQTGKQFRLKAKGMPVLRSRDAATSTSRSRSRRRRTSPGGSASCWRSSTSEARRRPSPKATASSPACGNSSTASAAAAGPEPAPPGLF